MRVLLLLLLMSLIVRVRILVINGGLLRSRVSRRRGCIMGMLRLVLRAVQRRMLGMMLAAVVLMGTITIIHVVSSSVVMLLVMPLVGGGRRPIIRAQAHVGSLLAFTRQALQIPVAFIPIIILAFSSGRSKLCIRSADVSRAPSAAPCTPTASGPCGEPGRRKLIVASATR